MSKAQQVSREKIALPAKQTYRLGELFVGAGGMAWGASQARLDGSRFSHAWVNDIDEDACDTFQENFRIEEKYLCRGDVNDLAFDTLPDVDGLVFGFPCNDFSLAGERKGRTGPYGRLYRSCIDALSFKKPLFFVAENVVGLASSGDDLRTIIDQLMETGYQVFRYKFRFEDYGVPQSRHRIVIVGFRNDLGISTFRPPNRTTKNKRSTCREALQGISKNAWNHEATNQSALVVERLSHIKPGQNAFNADLPDHLRISLKCGATISQIYKRLKPDEPAYTVTGSGGGGTHVYHWEENRALTNRERARLQTFPDNFVFRGRKESVRKQIGMAVPPKGARRIFVCVLRTLINAGIQSQC